MRYIPLEGTGETDLYVDTSTGQEMPWGRFVETSLFYDGVALAVRDEDGGGYGFFDKSGELLHETTYRDATIFHDGIAWAVESGGPLTVIDKKGRALFQFKQAETACAFHEDLAAFANAEGLWGLVDKNGKVVVEPEWADMIPMVVNGLIAVESETSGMWGLLNSKGKQVVNCTFKEIGTKNYKNGFLYNYIQALQEERIPFKDKNNKWGVIDGKGQVLINPQFDDLLLDGKNYLFRKGRLFGWCDGKGHYLIIRSSRMRFRSEKAIWLLSKMKTTVGVLSTEGANGLSIRSSAKQARFLLAGLHP